VVGFVGVLALVKASSERLDPCPTGDHDLGDPTELAHERLQFFVSELIGLHIIHSCLDRDGILIEFVARNR